MHFLKGCCTAEPCPYVHVNLPAGAPICTRFLRGYCPAGTACPHKHYTLRMVRDEKRMEAAPGGAAGAGQQQSKDGTQGQEEGGQEGEAGEPGPKRRRRSDVDAAEAAQQASDALKPAFLSADFVPL
ncbi:Zinc finger CCCH domain-containing 3 [Chlorella sorokiniana]|uniref:Zinc finger CCCH domain-containing 3 n=1 Tax=Chlorella sorokiniana TaxID=3076 RepID=A0A2P6U3P3_CHLSO|nr:Zinc finger CCCH domain-containing 3 [Chlorella sorokiniana]|eukprot:PRW60919.1 Zinc finger CCCH domain-containing 3 [Chlorella sorokiniana]